MERFHHIAYDLQKQWENGDRKYVLEALAELTPLQAAAVAIRIFGEMGREPSCGEQERFLLAVDREARE